MADQKERQHFVEQDGYMGQFFFKKTGSSKGKDKIQISVLDEFNLELDLKNTTI